MYVYIYIYISIRNPMNPLVFCMKLKNSHLMEFRGIYESTKTSTNTMQVAYTYTSTVCSTLACTCKCRKKISNKQNSNKHTVAHIHESIHDGTRCLIRCVAYGFHMYMHMLVLEAGMENQHCKKTRQTQISKKKS